MTTPITTDELRTAYNRVRAIRFVGWSFERMLAAPMMRARLEYLAQLARRRGERPQQEELFA